MTALVTPLPGLGCRHYRAGRCLIEEHRNPGLVVAHRCRVLEGLGRAYDDFLLRVDNMSLSEDQAASLWAARFPATLAREGDCRDYLPGDRQGFPDCRQASGDLCLLAFPFCTGRCARYARP
jgi:hypothetical protein